MNLLAVIHQRWAADAALSALLPPQRVLTGMGFNPTPPFALLGKTNQQPEARFNDTAAVDNVGLRVEVYDDQHDRAAAIAAQVKAAFHRAAFALAGADRVLDMRCANDHEQQQADGLWHMTLDFECVVYLADT